MGRLLIQFAGTNTTKALSETLPKNTIIVDEDLHQLRLHDGTTAGGYIIGGSSGGGVPVGTIIPFAGNSIPEGYLLCDYSAISRTDYALLFAVIGTIYGSGDGNSTFNLPDFREKTFWFNSTHSSGYNYDGYVPNITASVDGVDNVGAAIYRNGSGAFYLGTSYHFISAKSSATTDTFILKFDASRSSTIYGNAHDASLPSDSVVPRSLSCRALIKYI